MREAQTTADPANIPMVSSTRWLGEETPSGHSLPREPLKVLA